MLPPIDWKKRHALAQHPEPRPSRLARLFSAFRERHGITDEEVAQLTMKWSGGFW